MSGRAEDAETDGLLEAGSRALKVKMVAPTDGKNLAWRLFYGFWSAVGVARTSSRAALVIESNHSGTVAAIAGAGAVCAPIIGLGLAAAESIAVAVSFVITVLERRQAGEALRNAERRQLDAVDALTRHAQRTSDEAARACELDGASTRKRLVERLCQGIEPVQRDIGPGHSPDEAGAWRLHDAARPVVRDMQVDALKRGAHDAILHRTLAAVRNSNLCTETVEAGLTLSRDTVVQGALVGSATAQTLKELALNVAVVLKQAVLATQILGLAMGCAHIVTGIVALRRAVLDWRLQGKTMARFAAAKARLLRTADQQLSRREFNHKQRISTPFASASLRAYETIRVKVGTAAKRSAIFSGLRIGYGVGTVSVGIASMVVVAGATGGAAIPVVMAALATAWLIFAVIKLTGGKRAKAKEQREAAAFTTALARVRNACGRPCTLADCPIADLESLPSRHQGLKLSGNKYYRAALLAKYLHIDDEVSKNDNAAMKRSRGEASAVLQIMGVPRELTHILKRSSVQSTYSWILGYLSETDNRVLLAVDPAAVAAVQAAKAQIQDFPSAVAISTVEPHA